jgi:uncharacterized protein (DUF849 family)
MSKVIITAAITGSIHTPTMSPYLPITPDQIAENAVQAREAGAAVVHIHVRNPETGQPTPDLELFRKVLGKIKSKSDLVICTTTGGGFGQTPEQRVAVVPTFKPELASFNMGTMNFGLFPVLEKMKEFKFPWEKQFLEATEDVIAFNSFKSMKVFFEKFNENQTKPELEVYDAGMVNTVAYLHPIRPGHPGRHGRHRSKFGHPLRIGMPADRGKEFPLVSLRRGSKPDAHVHHVAAHGGQRPGGIGGRPAGEQGQTGQEQRRISGKNRAHRPGVRA